PDFSGGTYDAVFLIELCLPQTTQGGLDSLTILGVDGLKPRASTLIKTLARAAPDLLICRTDVEDASRRGFAVLFGNIKSCIDVLSKLPEPFFTFAQRIFDSLRLGDITHQTQNFVAVATDHAGLVIAILPKNWERILQETCLPGLRRLFETFCELICQPRRKHIAHVLPEELFGWDEQSARIFRVIIQIYPFLAVEKHQVRDRLEHSPIPCLALAQQDLLANQFSAVMRVLQLAWQLVKIAGVLDQITRSAEIERPKRLFFLTLPGNKHHGNARPVRFA